jgi:GEVED domain/Secretion system C-terminal sorting domain
MKSKILLFACLLLLSVGATKAQITSPAPYCDASFDDASGFPVDDHINSVSFGTLNNVSDSQWAAPHYVFYNNLAVASFSKGSTYKLKVVMNVLGGNGYGVWIDYNHNNVFDSIEKVAGTSGTTYLAMSSATADSAYVTIPNSALSGNTRMRVRIVEDDNYHGSFGTAERACNASSSATDVMDWGETEDYTINITPLTGIEEVQALEISASPNPFSTQVVVENKSGANAQYTMTDVNGKVIYQASSAEVHFSISTADLPSGIYFLQAMDVNTSDIRTMKLMK